MSAGVNAPTTRGQRAAARSRPASASRDERAHARELDGERDPRRAPSHIRALRRFERLKQRHSLSEIVIALRVPPEDVRELYHTWLVGLWAGELQRKQPALPARHTDQEATRRVTPVQLAQLLAALPAKQATRISIARMLGEFVIPDSQETDASFVEYRNLAELGGSTCPTRSPSRTSWRASVPASTV